MPHDDNPFFAPSQLPYQLPPFNKITEEHYLPAYERGMAEHREQIAAIADNPQPATVENTLEALERAGRLLARVSAVFGNLCSAHTNPRLQQIEQEVAPKLAAHHDAIFLNRRLYERVHTLYEQRDSLELDPESAWLLERYHTDFVRAGAQLSDSQQQRLREINQELSTLTTRFGNQLREDTNELAILVTERDRLAGMSEDAIAAAAEAARQRGQHGYLITLALPTDQPPLAWLHDRDLRERIHRASSARGARGNDHDTGQTVRRIVALRAERARLLGFDTHAAYQIADRTAGSVEAVETMLGKLMPAAATNARAEAAVLQEAITAAGHEFTLQPWDWAYYAGQVRQQRYQFDTAALRPYLDLERVLFDGVFFAATGLYGLQFIERHDLPTYHPHVRSFEVFEEDGTALGLFQADFYTRDSKRGGAWMSSFVVQSHLLDTRPAVLLNMNINRPPDGEPTLLTTDEVRTLFHEFGHVLHGLLSNVHYPRFAGTSVPRDFVEYPSQVNEVWMLWPEVLTNYARHHRTDEPLPAELADAWRNSRGFNEGFKTTEQLAATLLDLAWHRLTPDQIPDDVQRFEAEALAAAGADVPEVPPRYRTNYFAHIFQTDAYSAGYYSYIWSEVLDADTVEWFVDNGGLRRENGEWFRRQLLSKGGSIDSMAAFRAFRGRDPQIEPLLHRRGLHNG